MSRTVNSHCFDPHSARIDCQFMPHLYNLIKEIKVEFSSRKKSEVKMDDRVWNKF